MTRTSLPIKLKSYFWDYPFSKLSLDADRDLIIRRILSIGSWEAIRWLRKRIGDSDLRTWIIDHKGRGLLPQQLRYWELILEIPHRQVNQWVQTAKKSTWGKK